MAGQIVLKGNFVEANYTEADIPMHRHNLYIEALPDLLKVADVVKKVKRYPYYNSEDRKLPALRRVHRVQTISNFIEPLPIHIDFEMKFSRMIRHGYIARNPIKAEWIKQMRGGFEGLEWGTKDDQYEPLIRSTSAGFAIIGPSGIGKTTTIESILGLYPQVIQHVKYKDTIFEHKQLVWLKIDCPKDGSIKALCLNFFQSIDRVLGTKYFSRHSKSGSSAEVLIPEMANVANLFGLGVLVIDEIQRLSLAKSGGPESMMNFFVQLVNTIGVPVVPMGTPKALKIIEKDFANIRRFEGQGDIYASISHFDEAWDHFIRKLWKFQWTNVETPFTNDISKVLYDESHGIIDIAVKLFMLAQWRVIGEEDERLTIALIRDVSKNELRLVKKALNKVFTNASKLEELEEIFPDSIDLNNFLKNATERVVLLGKADTLHNQQKSSEELEGNQMSPLFSIAHWLVEAGIEPKLAQDCAKKALSNNGSNFDMGIAMQEAIQLAINNGSCKNSNEKKSKKAKKKNNLNENQMIEILKAEELDDYLEF